MVLSDHSSVATVIDEGQREKITYIESVSLNPRLYHLYSQSFYKI
jgi:hypothetical protein